MIITLPIKQRVLVIQFNCMMRVTIENNNLILTPPQNFDLAEIFDCGQCFRWNKEDDGSYFGVAHNKPLKISQSKDKLILFETSIDDYNNIWHSYFDLDRNYDDIRKELDSDDNLKGAFEFGKGIRILRQDLWECVVSFIISASNNIPRIKKIVELLCQSFGEKISYMGKSYYAFPTPQKIASLELEDLSVIKAGFRDKYILDAAIKFVTDERMNEDYLRSLSTEDAKSVLTEIKGIGSKVADCVLLFGLGKYDSFPIDVWMKRIMEHCYFDGIPQNIKTISAFAKEHFGDYGGFAQQYLFFYARENKIGL